MGRMRAIDVLIGVCFFAIALCGCIGRTTYVILRTDLISISRESHETAFPGVTIQDYDRVFVRQPNGRVSSVRNIKWDEIVDNTRFELRGTPEEGELALPSRSVGSFRFQGGELVHANFSWFEFKGWGFGASPNGPFATYPFTERDFARAFGSDYETSRRVSDRTFSPWP